MIAVTLSGKGDVRSIKIDPSLLVPDEAEILEDLIAAAFNDARTKVEARVQEATAKIMGGLQLPPGMKLDRKSVVWGTSGSVRVDLVGRSIIKKKKNTNKPT